MLQLVSTIYYPAYGHESARGHADGLFSFRKDTKRKWKRGECVWGVKCFLIYFQKSIKFIWYNRCQLIDINNMNKRNI